MDDIQFETLYEPIHNLIYNHTEFTIWLVISVFTFVTLRTMYYSLPFRRYMAIILILSGLSAYAIYNFVFTDQDRNILAQK